MLLSVFTPTLNIYSPTFLSAFILRSPIVPIFVTAILRGFSHHPNLALELTLQNPTLTDLGKWPSLTIVIVLLLYSVFELNGVS
jgi:hypothetical protein